MIKVFLLARFPSPWAHTSLRKLSAVSCGRQKGGKCLEPGICTREGSSRLPCMNRACLWTQRGFAGYGPEIQHLTKTQVSEGANRIWAYVQQSVPVGTGHFIFSRLLGKIQLSSSGFRSCCFVPWSQVLKWALGTSLLPSLSSCTRKCIQ